MLSVLWLVLTVLAPGGPRDFGRAQLMESLHAAGLGSRASSIEFRIDPALGSETYAIHAGASPLVIDAGDEPGAMYGALELAERVRTRGEDALSGADITGSPYLQDRGLNVFLTLPWNYQTNDTDYDPAALTDPARWWFANDDYWQTLLDTMARARLNWLDIHGTWDISLTSAPNLYAYFVQCPSFPSVGVPPEIKKANLARLNKVIDLAHARGIRVSLMAYEARLTTPHQPAPPYPADEQTAQDYTREAVEQMIRLAPGLDKIGFRIGESGHGEEFFRCYPQAVEKSGRDIPLETRSWITRRAKVLPLAAASSDFTVEIKFNGEQWGPPYLMAGGRTAGWHSYWFEDYLSDPGAGPFKQLWPGHALTGGGAWPSEPYKIVWQVRLNGTHRIFPFNDPEWVRGSVLSMRVGTASGFTVEPMNAYFPASPRYYLARPADQWCEWIHQRDERLLMAWGRLGYDPQTPSEVFFAFDRDRFGPRGEEIARAWHAASRIIPTAFSAYSLGPDHRNHAPELEWGGDSRTFIDREPFDSHVFMSVKEMVSLQGAGGADGRQTPLDVADMLDDLGQQAARLDDIPAAQLPPAAQGEFRELQVSTRMLGHLAQYYAARFRSAVALAQSEAHSPSQQDLRAQAGAWMALAADAWRQLSDSPEAAFYKPFTDRLRMGTNTFHWKNELPKVEAEAQRLPAPPGTASPQLPAPRLRTSHTDPALEYTISEGSINASIHGEDITRAWLLHKPLPSSTYFHKIPMLWDPSDRTFRASIPRLLAGHMLAAEIQRGGEHGSQRESQVTRIPSWNPGPPYIVVPSLPGPTPTYYSSEEALTYLRPEILSPDRYAMLVMCQRSWSTHRYFSVAVQRKLIDAVENGLPLLVLQQDYATGRYPLAWLGPQTPRVETSPSRLFDPAGTLSLPAIETDDLLWQRFKPAPGWEIIGNGGMAHATRGKGDIWMVQARLMQRMHIPECAGMMKSLLTLRGTDKPVIIVDAGSEGGEYTSSLYADFMNAHDIPFLTFGEVIASEQGTDSLTPIAGSVKADAILEGHGPAMVNQWLRAKVHRAASLPAPATLDEFNARRARQRPLLMQSLGLSPLPPRTPLNARITGSFQREGYHVERLVYESRPGFPVTALVYVPDAPAGTRFPVIVNPHGHWIHKKAEAVVQARAIAQALHGYLSIVVDSPGHSFEGDTPIERRWAGTHDDLNLTLSVGSTTGVYVWDLMRAVDYLQTRPDADTTRIGITGASGGGLATMYAFAADDRFTAAVPVCYATSMEINPDNGCLCNHVPGSLRVGDRADILALRAPAPILVLGASRDEEFPAEGTLLTGDKLKALYALHNAADRVHASIFDSGHDYNKPMREAAMGFFDMHLRARGDGSPIPEPAITPEPDGSPELVCLKDPPADLRTMRDLALEQLSLAPTSSASFDQVVALNGGLPATSPLRPRIIPEAHPSDDRKLILFESELGLTIPGVLLLPPPNSPQKLRGALVLVNEHEKSRSPADFETAALLDAGFACFCIDVRGIGELAGLNARLMTYLGVADAFSMGWDAARAAAALRELAPQLHIGSDVLIGVAGKGACASQAAMFAALFAPQHIHFVAGLDSIHEYADCLKPAVPTSAIQPSAASSAPLSRLRSFISQPAAWTYLDQPQPPRSPSQVILEAWGK